MLTPLFWYKNAKKHQIKAKYIIFYTKYLHIRDNLFIFAAFFKNHKYANQRKYP
jgi:hypothetical protein